MGLGKLFTNTAPVAYAATGGFRGMFSGGRIGAKRQIDSMGGNSTLFSTITVLTTKTSAVNWHLHRKVKGGTCAVLGCNEPDVVNVEDHLALRIWNKPNDFYTRQELVEGGQQHVDLTGEGWLLIERHASFKSLPVGLWLVRPDRIEVVPSKTDFIAGYIYHGPDGEQVPLGREDLLGMRMPNPADPYRGMGPVQTLMYNLDSARYSAEWNRNFFLNSAQPGGVIEIEGRLGDTQFKELRQRWNEQHQGVANAHRVAFLEHGGKWVTNAFSQKDMQFVELDKLGEDKILKAYGVPKFAIGEVADVNRATAEASAAWFAETLTVPRLDRWKGLLNNDFLPLFAGDASKLEFVYSNPVPANREADNAERVSKATAYKTLRDAGVDPLDAAEVSGLPPMRITTPQSAPVPTGVGA